MGEQLIRPYEISVWEDKLTPNGWEETKLAVIGSNTMTGLDRAYNPTFHKKANGEKTLSFSMKYKYFDPYNESNDLVNPFVDLLTNERKVKLYYDDKWYEFIVKDHTESSEEYTWEYTCTDAFVLELSKNGYNITFDSELNNNQGTAKELAEKTLENTDWRVGEVDLFKQYVAEPLYKAKLWTTEGVEIINASGNGESIPIPTPGNEIDIYLFYTQIKNQDTKNIQFIIRDNNRPQRIIDDKYVITDTNFRITSELVYGVNELYDSNETRIISIGEVETQYQGNRLAYNQKITYDPVMKRTVDLFKINGGEREVYRYIDYTYTTSNVLINYITNGENFNILEDGTLQGWNPYVDVPSGMTVNKLELVTKPELGTGKELADITLLSQVEGFLKVRFNGALTNNYENAVFNKGIENHVSFINSMSVGERYVFRWRAGVPAANLAANASEVDNLEPAQNLCLLVAKYTQDEPNRWTNYFKHIDPNNIILRFEGNPQILNNIIEGGVMVYNSITEKFDYVINDVPEVPSTKYVYIDSNDNKEYVWDGSTGNFILKDSSDYLPYYYLTGEVIKPIPNSVLTDPTQKIGIFVYNNNDSGQQTYYIQDIQLTKFMEDTGQEGHVPLTIGNVPTATLESTSYYYLKPDEGAAAEDVETYVNLGDLAISLGIQEEDITPIYNENSEKYLTISVSKSNCFNILQTIAETFECWVDLVVDHDDNGYITKDSSGRINKFVYLREYVGVENYAGFKYGINLRSIERTVNSDEFVTKLIVDQSQSDYADEGYISISAAPSNPTGESYILNFDYYYNQGLLDRESTEREVIRFVESVSKLNSNISIEEKKRIDFENSLVELGSKRNLYTELVSVAQDMKADALAEFENLTEQSYEQYKTEHPTLEEDKQLTEEQTILDVLGQIYSSSATINNYSGLLTNIEKEYWRVRKDLYGAQNFRVKIWTANDNTNIRHVYVELNDYLPGFSFVFDNNTDNRYTSTVSKKYFDITTNEAQVITFTVPSGYTIEQSTYRIVNNEVKRIKINSTSSEIGVEDIIKGYLEQKEDLVNSFSNKYSRFIQEGTWSSTDYIDSDLYYLDALQVSNTSAQPVVSYTINVIEISQIEGFEWYTFDAGDKSYIEDTEFFGWSKVNGILTPAREEVIVSEVEWHLDEPDQSTITVQNYKTRFEDLFQRINATVQTVQYNEATYAKTSSLLDSTGTINQNVLLDSLNSVSGKTYNLTSDGSVRIDGDSILVQNLNNSSDCVTINSKGISISSDGGATYTTVISGEGIDVGAASMGTLNTQEIIIGNKNQMSFRWDKSGISAYRISNRPINRAETREVYDLDTYVRFDQYGLYGIKENATFKARNLQDVIDKAHFAVTWDGFFIKNSYEGGGRVEITSDNDFRITKKVNNQEREVIKIGALEWPQGLSTTTIPQPGIAPSLYGIRITNDNNVETFKTGTDGNIEITGTLNATGGNFSGIVNVGSINQNYIIIDGNDASIKTSSYQDGAGAGWIINKDGDAVFNNITARGAIKTAVFEYAEIQAVGGIFVFRPSSTIRSAAIDGNDLVLEVEKPQLFAKTQNQQYSWCKISNYTTNGSEPNVQGILASNGLTHVYKVKNVDIVTKLVTLENAATFVSSIQQQGETAADVLASLSGGALVDMGREDKSTNYGIGINSSDNTVNLPRRAISLFETEVHPNATGDSPRITYDYKGILGTLPIMSYSGEYRQVDPLYHNYMENTQGIFTNNMYIGDANQYIAFYEGENHEKQLRIQAKQIMFEVVDEESGQSDWHDIADIEAEGVPGPRGQDAIQVIIDSSAGNVFVNGVISTILRCYVYKGGLDITSDNNYSKTYTWTKININDGSIDEEWTPTSVPLEANAIYVTNTDVTHKAVFQCSVDVEEV